MTRRLNILEVVMWKCEVISLHWLAAHHSLCSGSQHCFAQWVLQSQSSWEFRVNMTYQETIVPESFRVLMVWHRDSISLISMPDWCLTCSVKDMACWGRPFLLSLCLWDDVKACCSGQRAMWAALCCHSAGGTQALCYVLKGNNSQVVQCYQREGRASQTLLQFCFFC